MINSGDSVPSPAAGCQFEKPVPEPRAQLGILLVHGIGDHKEGETLTAFGEPLLDWMRLWLRGRGPRRQRGVLAVAEARLRTDGAPAYALAEVTMAATTDATDVAPEAPPASERWLVCEGWWGGSVQAPPSWDLLVWMWSRGPLLVYWHFYLVGVAMGYSSTQDPRHLFLLVPAFLLASFGQLAVSIAMVLWLIPVGPWRQGIVATVRVLTLTLGDSYVLLAQEIQRAALVERVRRSLAWLAARTETIVVVAHSQGSAIAHEALMRGAPATVGSFISLGSGLEKLHFLRSLLGRRTGLVASALVFPTCLLALGMTTVAWGASLYWQQALAWVCAGGVLVVVTIVHASLKQYREDAEASLDALKLPNTPDGIEWLDLFATRDVVSMGHGSLLRDAAFVTQEAVFNEGSVLRDHISYFTNCSDCLHRIWGAIAPQSRLTLFRPDDAVRLQRFARLHVHYGRIFAFSRLTSILAVFVIGFLLRNELVGFGQSVLAGVEGTPVADWLKPVTAVAAGLSWLVNRWWPGAATAATLTQAIFGLALLLGGVLLWWAAFRAFWRWRKNTRWRAAARGSDVRHSAGRRAARVVNLGLFGLVGSLPLIVALVIYARPELLTFDALGRVVAGIFSLLLLVLAFFYAAAGPLFDAHARGDQATTSGLRLVVSAGAAGLGLMLLAGARGLWPETLAPATENLIFSIVAASTAIGWQFYAMWVHRQALGPWMTWLVALLPPAGAAAFSYELGSRRSAVTYVAITAMLIGGAFLWHHRRELPQIARDAWRIVSSRGE